jgi:hypothetical protein
MSEIAQYSHDNMPMSDILSEIRDMVRGEAQTRYDAERTEAKRELLILRPEARVDLLLQEAAPTPAPAPQKVTAAELKASLEAEVFKARLRESFGISEPGELEELIRKVLREELGQSR